MTPIKSRLGKFIKNINPDVKRYIISTTRVFLSSFFGVLALAMSNGNLGEGSITVGLIMGVLTSAFSVGLKSVFEYLANPSKE